MRYREIEKELFVRNRRKFVQYLKASSVAIFNANDIMPTNADGTMPFRQNNDLFYLSGVDQEETILIIFPEASKKENREILFLRETNEEIAIWEGAKLTKEQARVQTGIQNIQWLSEFEKIIKSIIPESQHIYLNTNEHLRANRLVETRDGRFQKWITERYPVHKYERSAPIMHQLRAIKEPEEVKLIQEACDITEKAFRRILKFVKPGVMEYEIEAELWHELVRNRSRKPAYEPIIASGYNACVLHYIENAAQCQDGDVLLLDIGAEYANYAADLSRSIPVNGKFTKRQKDVYNAVLRVFKGAKEMLVPGMYLDDYHKKVGQLMEKELVDLGLLTMDEVKKNPADGKDINSAAYKKYFMHGTSHFLGLDVHDVGLWTEPIKENMVFTCEPGIYIKEESLGIRIENDFLVSKNGPVDLMKSIPIEAEEIEAIMNS